MVAPADQPHTVAAMLKTLFAATVMMFLASGCATVMRGTDQTVNFTSDPTAATVTVDGKQFTTPFQMKLVRNKTYAITASHEGYVPMKFELHAWRDLATAPDMLLPGGSVMMGTDIATGADRAYAPTINIVFHDKLNPNSPPATKPIQMKEFRGMVLTPEEYKKAEDRWNEQLKTAGQHQNAKHD